MKKSLNLKATMEAKTILNFHRSLKDGTATTILNLFIIENRLPIQLNLKDFHFIKTIKLIIYIHRSCTKQIMHQTDNILESQFLNLKLHR
jgi:hypothetical protein